jgi:hypothetical protein
MPARKLLTMALIFGMLLGYGWQSIVTSIVLRGIYLLIKKMVHFFQWVVEKLKKIIRFN